MRANDLFVPIIYGLAPIVLAAVISTILILGSSKAVEAKDECTGLCHPFGSRFIDGECHCATDSGYRLADEKAGGA